MPAPPIGELRLIGQVVRHARSAWRLIVALFVVSLLASPLALLQPLPLKLAVDNVLDGQPLPGFLDAVLPAGIANSTGALLLFVAAFVVGIALLSSVQTLAQKYLSTAAGERLSLELRSRLFRHLQRLSLTYHDATGTADSVYRLQSDAPAIRNIVIDGFIPFVSATVTLTGMIYVMARIDWQLALVALAISPPLAVLSGVYRPRLRQQSRRVRKRESGALAIAHEALGALRVVKAFGQEDREAEHFAHRLSRVMRRRLRVALLEGRYELHVGLLTAAGTATVLFIGVGHVRGGALTLGDLLLVMGYLAKLYQPVKTIARKSATLQGHLASAERAFALLEELPDVPERADARPIARAVGAVSFRNVSFAYGLDRPVLHDVSFDIQPSTRLGIIGTTGAGKSTLASLLSRLYDPTAGEILLDGVDLRDYRLDDLRRQFAVVPQDPVLFSVSVAENIAYADPGASRAFVVAAARAANAHEFIERLPQGYDTTVGERGVMLSGGQRQRIALARAFLKDSPVLILDEPTSAVDAQTEAAILDATLRLMRKRTVFLITHRASLLEGCTEVLALEGGRVASETTPMPAATEAQAPPRVQSIQRRNTIQHPAVQAWRRLSADLPLPERIAPLKRWNGKLSRERKTMVYRLEGVGPNGGAIIAKRCRIADAEIERNVHEEVLTSLELPLLGYHGCVEDPDDKIGWLFLEEATGQEFSVFLAEHRAQAGRWLGLLHSEASRARPTSRLRDASPARYLEHLRSARKRIGAHLDNPVLTPEDLSFLEDLVVRLDELEEGWDRLDEALDSAPETLVHGDFNGKNLRVNSANGAIEVFDWEDAGWGVPAVDLAQVVVPSTHLSANPDLDSYFSVVQGRWPRVNLESLRRLASAGTVFRAMAALDWESSNLGHDWASGFVMNMRLYRDELMYALDAVGWARGSQGGSDGRLVASARPAGRQGAAR